MRRIDVWVDCDEDKESETRIRIEAALTHLGLRYTILPTSTSLVGGKGSTK